MDNQEISTISEILATLAVNSKLEEIWNNLFSIFKVNFGTRSLIVLRYNEIEYTVGDENTDLSEFLKKTNSQLKLYGKYCIFSFKELKIGFDFYSNISRSFLELLYSILDNFLTSKYKYDYLYISNKYMRALIYSIEALLSEKSVTSSITHSFISISTFTNIKKLLVALVKGKSIEVIASIDISKNDIKIPEILKRINQAISSKEQIEIRPPIKKALFQDMDTLRFIPLKDMETQEVIGILLAGMKIQTSDIVSLEEEILKIISFLITQRLILYKWHAQLIIAKKKAEELSKLKSEFVANVSHELRTPLNAILGFSELIKMANLVSGEGKKYIDYITSSATNLLNMINNILDLSKIESNTVSVNFSKLKISEFIEELAHNAEALIRDKEVTFIKEENEHDEYILTDYSMLRSIITNILSNAIKFTEKGFVKMKISQENGNLIIEIEDTGIGMDKTEVEKIFQPFVQLEPVVNKKYQGTGIGLTVASKFAKMIGAKIEVTTKGKGKGMIFKVKLPLLS